MAAMQAKLVELFQLGSEMAGFLDLPLKFWPEAGQYLPCQRLSGAADPHFTHLFKVIGSHDRLSVSPLPGTWAPGDVLAFHPPQGHGFKLPVAARRIGLLTWKVSPTRILTLVEGALIQDAAVSLFCDPIPPAEILNRLPAVVEVNTISALQENLDWPDYLAVDLALSDLDQLSALLGSQDVRLDGQVLVRAAMPCRGLGDCGVCAVRTRQGWRLACVDGPVFPLAEVLRVA